MNTPRPGAIAGPAYGGCSAKHRRLSEQERDQAEEDEQHCREARVVAHLLPLVDPQGRV